MKKILPKLRRYMCFLKKMVFYEHIYEKNLDGQQVTWPEKIEFSTLKPKDYAAFADLLALQHNDETLFEPTYNMEGVQLRIKNEEICVICKHDNRIYGYLWIATRKIFIPEIQSTVELKPGEVYLYNCYIHKPYRRKGIATKLTNFSRTFFASKQYKKEIVSRMAWNYPAKEVLEQMNYTFSGCVIIFFFLGFRFSINNCQTIRLIQHANFLDIYRKLFMNYFKAS